MVNKVILVGNLGRDPEIRSLPSGQPVANFTMATSRKWKDQEGTRQEYTEWHNIVCFGRQAEVAGQYLTKGKQIYVEGRIQTRSWEQNGEKKYRTEIVCENFQMLGSRGDTHQAPPESAYADEPVAASSGGSGGGSGGGGDEDDDIPF